MDEFPTEEKRMKTACIWLNEKKEAIRNWEIFPSDKTKNKFLDIKKRTEKSDFSSSNRSELFDRIDEIIMMINRNSGLVLLVRSEVNSKE